MTHATIHRPFRHHYVTVTAGQQALRRSLLLLFLGVPAAAMGWMIWSLVFVGPSAAVQPQRFDGWGRVVVQMPGTLLVIGVAAAAVVFAARAGAARVEHAERVLGLTGLGLAAVLLALGTTVLHTVEGAPSALTTWGVRATALLVTAAVVVVAHFWARDARR